MDEVMGETGGATNIWINEIMCVCNKHTIVVYARLFLTVSWDPCAWLGTSNSVIIFL